MSLSLDITVSGIESIDTDLQPILQNIQSIIDASATEVGTLLMEALKQRIDIDVYLAYEPKAYVRRSQYTGFGTPLNDVEANSIPIWNDIITPTAKGRQVGLRYRPDGYNSATTADLPVDSDYYDADNPQEIKPPGTAVHGDDLIRRLETGKGYDWNVYPGKRPFWHNFVEQIFEGSDVKRILTSYFNMFNTPLDGEIVIESNPNEADY